LSQATCRKSLLGPEPSLSRRRTCSPSAKFAFFGRRLLSCTCGAKSTLALSLRHGLRCFPRSAACPPRLSPSSALPLDCSFSTLVLLLRSPFLALSGNPLLESLTPSTCSEPAKKSRCSRISLGLSGFLLSLLSLHA